MKNYIFLLLISFVLSGISVAQDDNGFPPPGHEGQMRRMDELEKTKLIDILDLDEDSFIKFFARRKEFKNTQFIAFQKKDSLLNFLEANLKSGDKSDEDNLKLVNEIIEVDQYSSKLHSQFISSLKEILPNSELIKYVVFERAFRRELRDSIMRHRGFKRKGRMPK